jgi:peptidoglycan/LPS O-acetylase OafA/YrhL
VEGEKEEVRPEAGLTLRVFPRQRGHPVEASRLANRHIPVLDGLRGFAIGAVIICHVNWAYGGPFTDGRVNGLVAVVLGWGWVGVDLFFVLSGFLITGILFDAKGGDGYFRNFYARRALRIMPLYFGFLFLTILVLPRLPGFFWPHHYLSRADALSLGLFYYNFRVGLTNSPLGYFHPFWSLSLEEHFYLLWPLVVWGLRRRPLMKVCLVAAGVSFVLRVIVVLAAGQPIGAFFFTPCRLDGLLAGSLVALAYRDPTDWAKLQRFAGLLTTGAGCFLLGIALGQRHFIPDVDVSRGDAPVDASLVLTVGIAALAVFFSGLLALTLSAGERSPLRRLLETNGLQAIGKYSYAIYVFHCLPLAIGVKLLSPLPRLEGFIAKPVAVIWVTAASFAAAWMSFHLYEKRFLRLKRFFEYRDPARSAAPVPSPDPCYRHVARELLPAVRPGIPGALFGGAQ